MIGCAFGVAAFASLFALLFVYFQKMFVKTVSTYQIIDTLYEVVISIAFGAAFVGIAVLGCWFLHYLGQVKM